MVEVRADILREAGELLHAAYPRAALERTVIVTDATVEQLYGDEVATSLRQAGFSVATVTIDPGEKSKTLGEAERIFRFLAGERLGRDGIVVALGGGVVSDLAGFAAGTWMRGVRWAICPTTLEAQIDAAIGGKTAVNVPGGKNLVGVFHPPGLVAIDPKCLATLPRRELVAGLAESVKHALIASEEFLRWHEVNVEKILALDGATMVLLIERNIAIKSAVVARDPRELTGERFVLNFGHTIGHAIEECSLNRRPEWSVASGQWPEDVSQATADAAAARGPHPGPPKGEGEVLRHGECVAMGMAAACRLSQRLGLLDAGVVERVEKLLARFGLPTRIPAEVNADELLDVMRVDKKARGGKVQFVLLGGMGRPVVRGEVADAAVAEALRRNDE